MRDQRHAHELPTQATPLRERVLHGVRSLAASPCHKPEALSQNRDHSWESMVALNERIQACDGCALMFVTRSGRRRELQVDDRGFGSSRPHDGSERKNKQQFGSERHLHSVFARGHTIVEARGSKCVCREQVKRWRSAPSDHAWMPGAPPQRGPRPSGRCRSVVQLIPARGKGRPIGYRSAFAGI